MAQLFTTKGFLNIGGAVLLALGILGFILWYATGQAENDVFYLDNGENVAHVVLGVVALALARVLPANGSLQRLVVAVVGIVALFFGIYGFTVAGEAHPNTFELANLENPLDNLLHLVVGAWGVMAAVRGGAAAKA